MTPGTVVRKTCVYVTMAMLMLARYHRSQGCLQASKPGSPRMDFSLADSMVYFRTTVAENQTFNSSIQLLDTSEGTYNITAVTSYPDEAWFWFSLYSNGTLTVIKDLDAENITGFCVDVTVSTGHHVINGTLEVSVSDINDNVPYMNLSNQVVDLPEDTPPGQVVTTIHAQDGDVSNDGFFFFLSEGADGTFAINRTSGVISLVHPLNCLRKQRYNISVHVIDHGQPPQLTSGYLTMNITENSTFPLPVDILNNVSSRTYSFHVNRTLDVGDPIGSLSEGQASFLTLNMLTFEFMSQSANEMFYLDNYSGILTLKKPLTSQQEEYFNISVKVTAGRCSKQSVVVVVKLFIENVTDEDVPHWLQPLPTIYVTRPSACDSPQSELMASYQKVAIVSSLASEPVLYSLQNQTSQDFFINETSGLLNVNSILPVGVYTVGLVACVRNTRRCSPVSMTVVVEAATAHQQCPEFCALLVNETFSSDDFTLLLESAGFRVATQCSQQFVLGETTVAGQTGTTFAPNATLLKSKTSVSSNSSSTSIAENTFPGIQVMPVFAGLGAISSTEIPLEPGGQCPRAEDALTFRELALITLSSVLFLVSCLTSVAVCILWRGGRPKDDNCDWKEEKLANSKTWERMNGDVKTKTSDRGQVDSVPITKHKNVDPAERDLIVEEEQEHSYFFQAETDSLGLNTLARREHRLDMEMEKLQGLFQAIAVEKREAIHHSPASSSPLELSTRGQKEIFEQFKPKGPLEPGMFITQPSLAGDPYHEFTHTKEESSTKIPVFNAMSDSESLEALVSVMSHGSEHGKPLDSDPVGKNLDLSFVSNSKTYSLNQLESSNHSKIKTTDLLNQPQNSSHLNNTRNDIYNSTSESSQEMHNDMSATRPHVNTEMLFVQEFKSVRNEDKQTVSPDYNDKYEHTMFLDDAKDTHEQPITLSKYNNEDEELQSFNSVDKNYLTLLSKKEKIKEQHLSLDEDEDVTTHF